MCMTVKDICGDYGLDGHNATFCHDTTEDVLVPIRNKIKRVLASEEYY